MGLMLDPGPPPSCLQDTYSYMYGREKGLIEARDSDTASASSQPLIPRVCLKMASMRAVQPLGDPLFGSWRVAHAIDGCGLWLSPDVCLRQSGAQSAASAELRKLISVGNVWKGTPNNDCVASEPVNGPIGQPQTLRRGCRGPQNITSSFWPDWAQLTTLLPFHRPWGGGGVFSLDQDRRRDQGPGWLRA